MLLLSLHREIVQHGGLFLQYLDSKTMATHIIASSLTPKKAVEFNRYRIVKPAWVVDSIKAGKLLAWTDYNVLDEGSRQKVLKLDSGSGLTQASPRTQQGYKEQTDSSFYSDQFKAAKLPTQSPSLVAEKFRSQCGTTTACVDGFAGVHMQSHGQDHLVKDLPTSKEHSTQGPGAENAGSRTPTAESMRSEERHNCTKPTKKLTSEEHNAWLLSDPRLRKSSVANPEFLKQFYAESRLHHLSTWKADLKGQMQRLAAEKGLVGNGTKKKPGSRSYIMHVDFDSFFCAVSLKRHPEFVDQPAVVAHSTGSGSEIASCNYIARKFGVKNGMWMKRALELCVDLKVMPYHFADYEEASRKFYESIIRVGGIVQSVSIDEALIDATSIVLSSAESHGLGVDEGSIWREQDKADRIASTLRQTVKACTGCDVSVGIGGNILQAKVALRKAKPAGQYQLKPEDVLCVIGELKVEELPGVSYSIGGKLEEIGVKLVKDLRDVSKERLATALGPKTGERLHEYARGIDRTEVGQQPPRKSVSAEVNWGIRFISQPEAEEFIYNLCKELERRLLNEQVKGRQFTMKIMRRSLDAPLDPAKHLGHGKCDVFNKSVAFGVATHDCELIGKEAVSILRNFKISPGDLRGLGVQMTKLEPIRSNASLRESSQKRLSFFTETSPATRRLSEPEAIDEVENLDNEERGSQGHHTHPQRSEIWQDPIFDEPVTPKKPRFHPAVAAAGNAPQGDGRDKTPLNVSGTQFILPSNADAAIVGQMPNDIRSKLMNQPARAARKLEPSFDRPRQVSPLGPECLPSQVDPEVFNGLPEDVKAEVLASYGSNALLWPPQRDFPSARHGKQATPTKRRASRNIVGKGQRQRAAQAGLLQTNFRAAPGGATQGEGIENVEQLDPDFLSELPEDIRREVVAEHGRRRLAQQSRLEAPAPRRPLVEPEALASGQGTVRFAARPPKISFANSGITSTAEIKDMLDAWHTETQDDGPHRGDVEVLAKYLARIVSEERDLEKTGALVRWLRLIVEQDGREGCGKRAWRDAIRQVEEAVQDAVRRRGMAPLRF